MTPDCLTPEYTFEEFCALPMTLGLHISGDKEHYIHRYNPSTQVQKVTITPVKTNGGFGIPKSIYYFYNDPRNFDTVDQIYVAYMESVCGVTP